MRLNENMSIVGKGVILVPYKEIHVPKYHDWMKSEDLQYQTASEPLSIEEEYQMQRSWHSDENKCTFIVLDKSSFLKSQDEIDAMIGDTNLFLSDDNRCQAEAEIMIADRSSRGKKRGWEAMLLMLRYGCEELNIEVYEAKIKFDNVISIKMFSKMGFSESSRSEIFQECTMKKEVTKEWLDWISSETDIYLKKQYNTISEIDQLDSC